MFSVPLNPKLTPDQFDYFLNFLKKYKHLIYDVYFTSRIPPFTQDAMGDVFNETQFNLLNENAFIISKVTGVPLSATFNNIEVPPTSENLTIFIENFKRLYDKGVRIVTIPHTLWMLTGRFQKEYPDVLIKNTILRNTQRANEVIKCVEAGFHYINFDRDLMRDEDTLKRMQDAKRYCKDKLGVDVKFSLLANEGCFGNCSVQDEHFLYNNTRSKGNQPTYFQTDISYFSCPKWEEQDPAYHWRIANFPPFKDEWDRLLTYIDVIKMHGRESVSRLFETLKIIEKFANNEQILYTDFEIFIKDNKFAQKRIDVWKTTIRNCKFDCWDCNVCDKIVEKNNSVNLIDTVKNALIKSKNNESKISEKTKNLPGLTSEKVKHFINNLCELPDCKYLEAGVFQGSIFAAAVEKNDLVATAIDNFSESSIIPMDSNVNINSEKGNNKEIFLKNIKDLVLNKQVNIIDSNVFEADLNKITLKSNVIFMDIEHTYQSHYNFLNKFYEKIDNTFVYVVDDWNWLQVREATFKSIEDLKLKTLFKEEIFTKGEDKSDYWNGLGIFVLNKI
jgi:hypothetical protein